MIGNNNTDLGGPRLPGGDEEMSAGAELRVSCIRIWELAVYGSLFLGLNFGPDFVRLRMEERLLALCCCFSWRRSC